MNDKVCAENLENVAEHFVHVHRFDDFVVDEVVHLFNSVMVGIVRFANICILIDDVHIVKDEPVLYLGSLIVTQVFVERAR